MAAIAVNPFAMKNALLLVPTDDYAAHVSSVECVPTTSTVTWTGLAGNTFTDASTPTWVLNAAYAQDWENPNSLANYFLAHVGEEIEVTFEPVAGGAGFTVTVKIVPGAIGGAVNAVAVANVSLPVIGQPVLVPAA